MRSNAAVVLNNIGGGINVWVDRLPSVGESVMGFGFDVPMDLAKGGNVAVALERLGVPTAIVGKLGCDAAGERDTKWLMDAGVDCEHLLHSPEARTGQGLGINEVGTGRNLIVTGETSSKWLSFDEVEHALRALEGAQYFVTGFEIKEELVLPAAKLAHELGMKVFLNPSPLPKLTMGALPYVDCLIVNDIEAKKLLELDEGRPFDAKAACYALEEKYETKQVIITLGGEGYAGLDHGSFFSGEQVHIPPEELADTSGAGDGFLSAVIANLYWGKGLEEACSWANKYAARVVTVEGTVMGYSTVEELTEFCASHGVTLNQVRKPCS